MSGRRLAEALARETGITNARLLDAFASIPRERFLGDPPWLIAKTPLDGGMQSIYEETDDADALYANVSVALDADRQLFNGPPGTVGSWIAVLDVQLGERVFHVGCGTGYYTAILAELAGSRGSVIGVDVDEELIDRANDALAHVPNVSILKADATTFAPSFFDAAIANMGVSVIPPLWLSRMNPKRGRFVIPLAAPLPRRGGAAFLSKSIVFLIERDDDAYSARMIGGAIIFTAIGSTNEDAQKRLWRSLETSDPHGVHSLRRDRHEADATCWLHEDDYCFSRNSV